MVYRNTSGWDDSGAHVHVRLSQGDTYRHNGIEYAHDGLPISDHREEHPAPGPQREARASEGSRPLQSTSRPRAETQPHRRTLRDFYEENPPPPRPRYTEEDELIEYHAFRNTLDRLNTPGNRGQHNGPSASGGHRPSCPRYNRRNDPSPPPCPHRRGPSPGSYQYYLRDNEYHQSAHVNGQIAEVCDMFSPDELIQYRGYDEEYYAGRHRSPIHGAEGHYGDNLRHERFISGGPHYEDINPRQRQSFFNPAPPPRSNPPAFNNPSPMERAEAQGVFGPRRSSNRFAFDEPSPMEIAEAEGVFGSSRYDAEDSLRYDADDPCPNPSAHIGRAGICFRRRDAGYPG